MKKLIGAVVCAAVTVSALSALAQGDIKVIVNDNEVHFSDQAPVIDNDRTLVPMRAIFEALGATVGWDQDTKTVTSYDPVSETSIVLQIDSDKMFVNDTEVKLDVPAKLVNDRTLVPVRAIAEGMNSTVSWDQDTKTVNVSKDMTTIANPWQEFKTLDELNSAINESDANVKYAVSNPSDPVVIDAYRYLEAENMTELTGRWEVGEGAELVIRTAPADADISGISGGQKQEEYTFGDSLVEIYKYENTLYAIWACDDAGTVFSHSVSITTDAFDATDVLKSLVEDVESHPRG